MEKMCKEALRPSTRKAYQQHWDAFTQFLVNQLGVQVGVPANPRHVLLFLADLYDKNLQHATLLNYASAIAYQHKMADADDPTATFKVQKFLQGVKNTRPQSQKLHPISTSILRDLLIAVPLTTVNLYMETLIKSMMSLMYWACLRIGEVATSTHGDHVLRLDQLSFEYIGARPSAAIITFKSFKHSKGAKPILNIRARPDRSICPVTGLQDYLRLRSQTQCPALFVTSCGQPVTRADFVAWLGQALDKTPHTNLKINSHSFRVGRATDLALQGKSDAYIQKAGRWSSSAYRKYVRPQAVPM